MAIKIKLTELVDKLAIAAGKTSPKWLLKSSICIWLQFFKDGRNPKSSVELLPRLLVPKPSHQRCTRCPKLFGTTPTKLFVERKSA